MTKIQDINVGIVGATGAVGREIIQILESKELYPKSIRFAASENSEGQLIEFAGKNIRVEKISEQFFKNMDIAICSAGSAVSKKWIQPEILNHTIAIDNCSFHRMDPEVPLVVPEVNVSALAARPTKSIIANPNCTTIAMVVALHPIHKKWKIEKIICSSYQSVSGAGQKGIEELSNQVVGLLQSKEPEPKIFPKTIAFNLIPNIGGFLENDSSVEEQKMVDETHKIFEDDAIQVAPTCVRVPTMVGHGLSLYVETTQRITATEVKRILTEAPGVTLLDSPQESLYPVLSDCQGNDDVYVGRVRQGTTTNSCQLWVVSDNLRKGAALNAVQILESVITRPWFA